MWLNYVVSRSGFSALCVKEYEIRVSPICNQIYLIGLWKLFTTVTSIK